MAKDVLKAGEKRKKRPARLIAFCTGSGSQFLAFSDDIVTISVNKGAVGEKKALLQGCSGVRKVKIYGKGRSPALDMYMTAKPWPPCTKPF